MLFACTKLKSRSTFPWTPQRQLFLNPVFVSQLPAHETLSPPDVHRACRLLGAVAQASASPNPGGRTPTFFQQKRDNVSQLGPAGPGQKPEVKHHPTPPHEGYGQLGTLKGAVTEESFSLQSLSHPSPPHLRLNLMFLQDRQYGASGIGSSKPPPNTTNALSKSYSDVTFRLKMFLTSTCLGNEVLQQPAQFYNYFIVTYH